MLFLTVYGRELESIFCYVHQYTQKKGAVSQEQIYTAFLPHGSTSSKGRTKNIEDGLNYLKCALLIEGENIYTSTLCDGDASLPFAVILLRQFRKIEHLALQASSLDLLYVTLLEQLYILPNVMWIHDVHAAANQLELARQVGGVSQEKINAWKRVMEFLGIGYRFEGGFYCLYQPKLMESLIKQWTMKDGTLQDFFEGFLQLWLPCLSMQGDVALSVAPSFDQLSQEGRICLYPKQDSPSKSYFNRRRLRGIEIL